MLDNCRIVRQGDENGILYAKLIQMKVLYIGSLQPTACATFYLHAMEHLGFEVTPFDPKYFETAGTWDSLLLRIRKGPSAAKLQTVSEKLLALCKGHVFDAVFVVAENFLPPETIAEIKASQKPTPLFLYHSHDNNYSSGILKPGHFFSTLLEYDFVFTTKSPNVARYKTEGQAHSYFIPSAFDPNVHRPMDNDNSLIGNGFFDISFVGTYDYSRDKFLNQIGWERLYVWGNEWKRFKDFSKHQERIVPRAIYLDEYADVVSHSKVSLGLLREEAGDLHTQRTFEIPACGSFQIAPRNEEILSFFDENKEVVCFSSPEELADKTHYYLANETLRQKIAQAGYERCVKSRHTYLDRVETIFKTAGLLERQAGSQHRKSLG